MSAPITALVVDDEPLARRRRAQLLHDDPDIQVIGTFGSATEAAERAGELAPQLLLLDIRMPGLDGFELVQSLAVRGVNFFVIFVAARIDRSMDAMAMPFCTDSDPTTVPAPAQPGASPGAAACKAPR